MEGESYKFINIHRVFKLTSSFHCKSINLIYVVIFSGYFEEYIGETDGQLKDRLLIYRKRIR